MWEGVNLINNFKVISSTSQELMKISDIQNTNKKLSDKEKFVYSMIIFLSKENECTISSAYIGNL